MQIKSTLVIPALPFLSASVCRCTLKKLVLADQAAEQHCGERSRPIMSFGKAGAGLGTMLNAPCGCNSLGTLAGDTFCHHMKEENECSPPGQSHQNFYSSLLHQSG